MTLRTRSLEETDERHHGEARPRFYPRLRRTNRAGVEGLGDPEMVMQWWGPDGFTSPSARMDFREGEAMGGGTLNTLILQEHATKTTMTATILYKSRAARDAAIQTPMEEGAAEGFDRLAELLETLL